MAERRRDRGLPRRVRELDSSGSRGFAIGTGDWPLRGLVLRDATGRVQAFLDRCPHAGHPLASDSTTNF
jgi:nitrite reductase/ring-hydroxylating ferredoxin subunit